MRYEKRVEELLRGHKVLVEMQDGYIKGVRFPEHLKREKLEAAIEELKNDYVIVFKRKEEGHK